jgi:hypothetical protein
MRDPRPFFHGWRARAHYLTRNRHFLLRTSAVIIALGMIAACTIVLVRQQQEENHGPEFTVSPALNLIHQEYHQLRHSQEPRPRQFAIWLRRLLAQLPKLVDSDESSEYAGFTTSGHLIGYHVAELINQHATTDAPAGLFHDFLAAAIGANEAAFEKIEAKAQAEPPPMLAAELYGSIQKRRSDSPAAMQAFFTEGRHFADATAAREEALRLAVTFRELDMLRRISTQPGWIEDCHPLLQHHAGALLGDVWMQWRGLVHHRINAIPYGMLALAFFVAALWYFILVQHSDHARWRWARPMPALMAGVCSVWPTLTLLAYQEFQQGMTANAPFPHDLIYYLAGVGLREEGCKLLLFALFLPWLLCAHSLYRMLLTRFARADEFIGTFLAAVAAHGAYDWLGTDVFDDNGWLSIIVLVLTVSRFIDQLALETRPTRLTISPRAVFTFGSATLIALSFVLGAWTTRSMEGVANAGQECLAMIPIALLYWRKFENV